MRILSFYILRAFGKPFLMAIIFFTGLIIISHLFRQTGLLIGHQVPPLIMVKYFLYQVPFTMVLVTPIAVLLACLFAFGTLSYHNEIIAMKSSGVNLYRLIIPIWLTALLISLLSFIWNEFVVPEANQRLLNIKLQKINQQNISYQAENFSLRSDKGWFWRIKLFDKEKGIMEGVEIKARFPDGQLSIRIDAQKAKWIGNSWLLEEGILRQFNQQRLIIKEEKFKKKKIPMWSPDQIWMINNVEKKEADEMSMRELGAYIRLLQASGSKFNDKLVDLYLKVSFPLTNLIIALMGTGLSLQRPKGGRAASFGMSILISFFYWIAIGLGRALGMAEKLPPLFSAWIANIIFGLIGIYLAFKTKK